MVTLDELVKKLTKVPAKELSELNEMISVVESLHSGDIPAGTATGDSSSVAELEEKLDLTTEMLYKYKVEMNEMQQRLWHTQDRLTIAEQVTVETQLRALREVGSSVQLEQTQQRPAAHTGLNVTV